MCETYLLLHFTSVSLYNLKSALTTSQIWQYRFILFIPVAKLTCALVKADTEGGSGGWSRFIGRCLTNEQRQPVRLGMLEINIFMHKYVIFYNPWTIFSLNIISFNGILYYSKRVAKSFIGWNQPMKWDVFVRDDVPTKSRSRRFGQTLYTYITYIMSMVLVVKVEACHRDYYCCCILHECNLNCFLSTEAEFRNRKWIQIQILMWQILEFCYWSTFILNNRLNELNSSQHLSNEPITSLLEPKSNATTILPCSLLEICLGYDCAIF